MRPRTAAAVAATTVLGAAAAVVAAGRHACDNALKPSRPLPSDPRLTVHATTADEVALTRALASQRPGTYGITGRDTHAAVGPVLGGASHSADTVVRRLDRVQRGHLRPGSRVRLTPQVYVGDPGEAHGLDYEDVEVPGELGTLPGWLLPGGRDTWVITAHGLGTTREHPMVVMPFLRERQLPVLDIAYRGDPGAPRSPDGVGHLGDTEWRDLDAAVRFAVRSGARRVVLYGWSTGATMALRTAADSALRHRISGLVLDSPVLDWRATVRALAAAHRTPGPLLPLAVRAAQGRAGLGDGSRAGLGDGSRAGLGDGSRAGLGDGSRAGLGDGSRAGSGDGSRAGFGHGGPAGTPGDGGAGPGERVALGAGSRSGAWDPAGISVPTLIVHGPDDRLAPWDTSSRLAAARPDLVSLHVVRHAPHAAMWNADPEGYEEALRRFLTPLM